jgi:hypothetical protein
MTMREHVRLLAIIQLVWSAIGFLLGVLALFFFGGIGMMVATEAATSDPDAAAAPAIVGLIVVGLALLMLVLTIPGALAGWGLLNGKSWARILTIVLSALNLVNVPIGTALGIYGIWVMVNPEVEAQFSGRAPIQPTAAEYKG